MTQGFVKLEFGPPEDNSRYHSESDESLPGILKCHGFLGMVSEPTTKEISWDQLNLSLTVQVNGLAVGIWCSNIINIYVYNLPLQEQLQNIFQEKTLVLPELPCCISLPSVPGDRNTKVMGTMSYPTIPPIDPVRALCISRSRRSQRVVSPCEKTACRCKQSSNKVTCASCGSPLSLQVVPQRSIKGTIGGFCILWVRREAFREL